MYLTTAHWVVIRQLMMASSSSALQRAQLVAKTVKQNPNSLFPYSCHTVDLQSPNCHFVLVVPVTMAGTHIVMLKR